MNSPSEYESEKPVLSREFVGSENYTAPEIVKRASYDPFKVDTWSCGIVLFSLLFGQFPWDDLTKILDLNPTSTAALEQPKIRFPRDTAVSDSAKQLVIQMLNVNPEKRLSMKQILQHEWLSTPSPKVVAQES